MELENDEFFDINKFPAKHGMIVFPISMSRIYNSQSGDKYFEYLQYFESKAKKPLVGVTFIYTDSLYRRYNQESGEHMKKYFNMMLDHKNAYLKKLRKTLYLEKATSFFTWDQICFNVEKFDIYMEKVKDFYNKDAMWKEFIKIDIEESGREVNNQNINFIIEESLISYFITKGRAFLPNEFVQNHEEWILLCYPGKKMISFVYFYQKNIFNINNEKNIYQDSFYDLDNKKLFDYNKLTCN